jgi:hypothetical protein
MKYMEEKKGKISSEPLATKGKIVAENGKHFLEIDSGSHAGKYPVGLLIESTMPREIVGKIWI